MKQPQYMHVSLIFHTKKRRVENIDRIWRMSIEGEIYDVKYFEMHAEQVQRISPQCQLKDTHD